MYMVYDQVLIVRSSNSIEFYRKCLGEDELDHDTVDLGMWEQYHVIDEMRGQISF